MLASVLAVAVAVATPQVRTFWKVEEAPHPQPVQGRVTADLVGEGSHLVIYRERGYRFSTQGETDEASQITAAISTFDDVIFPRLVDLYGPCPDVDGNGKVILLITRSTRDENPFVSFDLLGDVESLAAGLHSNEAEILYLSFSQQGNRSSANLADLARAFHLLLHWSNDPGEVSWAELLASYSAIDCGLESHRALWGDSGHLTPSPSPADPWGPGGWPLLYIEYLRDHLGDRVLRELVRRREPGQAGLDAALTALDPASSPGFLADFAMACWLNDQGISSGRFAFTDLAPPRPPLAARAPASRPTSGQMSCGVGGMVHLLIEGDGERPQPLALRADPRVRWAGRAVHLRQRGPDAEMELRFDDRGLARLELPLLPRGDGVIISVTASPPAIAEFDPRTVAVMWGLGWVPREFASSDFAQIRPLGERLFGAATTSTVERVAGTLDRLGGLAPAETGGPPLHTRYAWAPAASRVVSLVEREAEARGLAPKPLVFLRSAPGDVRQDWTDVLVELEGLDERRWPVVVAAHWDAVKEGLAASYEHALGIDDNAAGVVAALEAAQLLAGTRPRSPIVVALLAGGNHGAAGAGALLEHLNGHVSAWIELDGVGRPGPGQRQTEVLVEGGGERDPLTRTLVSALSSVGLTPVVVREVASPHTGAALAKAKGIPTLVVRTRDADSSEADVATPAEIERERVSEELVALIGHAVGRTVSALAGNSSGR